jgi:hypothetical protein
LLPLRRFGVAGGAFYISFRLLVKVFSSVPVIMGWALISVGSVDDPDGDPATVLELAPHEVA